MLKSCCLCLPVETGVYIIGVANMLTLVPEYYEFQMARTLFTLVATLAFFYMLANDGAFSRGLFFWTFLISGFSYYIISLFIATEEEGGFDAQARAEDQCAGLADEWLSNYLFNTVDACELASERYIVYEMVGIMIPVILVTIYCCMVLFAHWQNAIKADNYTRIN